MLIHDYDASQDPKAEGLFSVGLPPSLASVAPRRVCEGPSSYSFALTGTGFVGATQVSLATTPAESSTAVSSTLLVASFPAPDPGRTP